MLTHIYPGGDHDRPKMRPSENLLEACAIDTQKGLGQSCRRILSPRLDAVR